MLAATISQVAKGTHYRNREAKIYKIKFLRLYYEALVHFSRDILDWLHIQFS